MLPGSETPKCDRISQDVNYRLMTFPLSVYIFLCPVILWVWQSDVSILVFKSSSTRQIQLITVKYLDSKCTLELLPATAADWLHKIPWLSLPQLSRRPLPLSTSGRRGSWLAESRPRAPARRRSQTADAHRKRTKRVSSLRLSRVAPVTFPPMTYLRFVTFSGSGAPTKLGSCACPSIPSWTTWASSWRPCTPFLPTPARILTRFLVVNLQVPPESPPWFKTPFEVKKSQRMPFVDYHFIGTWR